MILVRKTVISVVSSLVILFLSGCLLVYMKTSPRFEITRVGVRGNSRLVPESIVEYLDIQPHTNIFQIRLDDIQKRLEALQWVKTVKVFRNFPDKISIDLTERTPFALVKLDKLHLVDRDGVILEALTSGNAITLPIITGSFVEQIDPKGENVKLRQALHAIHDLMNKSLPAFKNIRKIQIQCLENTTLLSSDPSYPEIRISLVDYSQNVQRLQRIYPTLHLEELAYIDLRFDKRIIVTSNKS
jgi:cell division protein FtsQ